MNFSHFFVRRPIFAGVLSAIIFLIGLLAMGRLPVSEYPEVTPPTVVVRALYPGANPKTISETVAAPLEQAINGVENSIYMFSQSTSDGAMSLTVTFKLGTDVDQAQVQVQNRVSQALPKLPEEVRRLGVTTVKQSPDLTLVVHLFSPAGRYDEVYVRNYATLQVKDVLARLPGVGQVEVFGGGDYAMRIWLDPEQIAARGLTVGDVIAAIREQNVQVAAGAVGKPPSTQSAFELQVEAKGRLVDEEEFRDIVVKQGPHGEKVLLRHVARVELGAGEYALRSLLDNRTAVGIAIFQLPGSNALQISQDVRAAMAQLAANFPQDLDFDIVYDPTVFVQRSIDAVVLTLLEAIVLVVLVVILFLQTWRASLIPLAAVPVSLVGTFAVMQALGFGINALSLFGLVLSIGIVVDDAIVVVENVERNIRNGLSPVEATKKAMTEVTGPIIATALVLSAVFIPTAFISGLTGQFYEQFAITIAISTIISAFNSLTLSPALSALLLQPHGARKDALTRIIDALFGWLFRPFNWLFERGSAWYGRAVGRVIRLAAIVLVVYGGLVAATYWSFQKVPTGFVPTQDKQYLIAFAQLPDASSLERTDAVIRRMSEIALAHPGVASSVAFPGLSINGFSVSPNSGIVFVGLDPFEERQSPELAGLAIAGALNQKFAVIQDAFVAVFPPPAVNGLGQIGGFKLFVEDRADQGLDALFGATWGLIGRAAQAPELDPRATFSTFQVNVPQLAVDVDRDKAKTQGVPLAGVFEAMQVNLGSLYVNDFNRFGRTYQVVAQADAQFRDEPSDITRLKVRNDRGQMVSLGTLVDVRESYGPDRVSRYNGYPAAEINGAPAAGFSSGQAEAAMAQLAQEHLPPGMKFEWTDLTYQKILAGNTAVYVFPLSILLVFLVLAAQYESFRMPLAILLIVPMSLLSAMTGVILTEGDNNVFTQIGLMVLIGLAAKNAILIVEFAKVKQDEGLDPASAAIEAAKLRLRPILMTSIAFIAGVFPLVISEGAGSEMRRAMGVAVFAGMIGVTFFGLLLTPLFYALLLRIGWKRSTSARDEPAPVPPRVDGEGGAHGLPQAAGGAAAVLVLSSLLLAGCAAVGPDYQRPETAAVSAPDWRDAPDLPPSAAEIPRGAWWRVFDDAGLDALQERVAAANHDLKAALARIEQALAGTKAVRANLYPSISANPTWTRTEYSPNAGLPFSSATVSDIRVPVDLAWEIDLWGRVRRAVEAGERETDALAAAYESLRLSIHAEVAASWFTLRALDSEVDVLRRSVDVRRNALEIISSRLAAGTSNELDLARVENEVAIAEADLADVTRQREALRNALAVLAGEAPSGFQVEVGAWIAAEPPAIPAGLPSELLERRPDIAAAERELAARNARIGVAVASYFPSIRLTGSAGYQSGELDDLFTAESRIWSLAPSISIPIFEGGRLEAEEQRARAAYEESLQLYRQRVLLAFREVQDALTATRLFAEQAAAQERATAAAKRVSDLSRTRFEAGFVSFLDVVDGARARLAAERASVQLQGRRFVNAVALVRALGGGWDATDLPRLAAGG
ncbi:MAG: multidrug efflux RND transporter permease subunit [Planctomycetes bacterium]|nr:multidrug efflux RND transporter permease subunit [Planctomycetota bacterium]